MIDILFYCVLFVDNEKFIGFYVILIGVINLLVIFVGS